MHIKSLMLGVCDDCIGCLVLLVFPLGSCVCECCDTGLPGVVMFRRFFLFFVALLFSVHGIAGTVVAYNGRMNNAVSGVVTAKLVQRGFGMNDPRIQATLTGLGAAGGTVVSLAGTAVAVGGTPVWLSILAAGLLVGSITGAVKLALDGDSSWEAHSMGVSVIGPRPLLVGDPVYLSRWDDVDSFHSTAEAAAQTLFPRSTVNKCIYEYWKYGRQSARCYGVLRDPVRSTDFSKNEYGDFLYDFYPWGSAEIACDSGSYVRILNSDPSKAPTYQCIKAVWTGYEKSVNRTKAVDTITSGDFGRRLNPSITAAVANLMLSEAAKTEGYGGIAPDLANPVTAEDVLNWENANPSSAPTVGDAAAPMQKTAGGPVAMPETSGTAANPATNPGVNPASSQPQTNVGSDPGIGSPSLENVPSASDILKPILNLLPDWRAFKLPEHQSECPRPRMDLWGKEIVMSMHCDLLEQQRSTIQAIMAVVWTLAAAIIILGA